MNIPTNLKVISSGNMPNPTTTLFKGEMAFGKINGTGNIRLFVNDNNSVTELPLSSQSDWNATTGTAVILNKPIIPDSNSFVPWGYGRSAGCTSYPIGADSEVDNPAYASLAIGFHATARGDNATAIGGAAIANASSTVLGYSAVSLSNNSVAIGLSSNASSDYSIAVGYYSQAINPNSISIGANANAAAYNGIAIGTNVRTSGYSAIAIGYNAQAYGLMGANNCISIGNYANVNGGLSSISNSIAIGSGSTINANNSIAIGTTAYSQADNAIAIGVGSQATSLNSTAIGEWTQVRAYNSMGLGANVVIAASSPNTIRLGDSNISTISGQVAFTFPSDERDKTDIVPITKSLEFINSIEPIQYVDNDRHKYYIETEDEEILNKRKHGIYSYDKEAHIQGTEKGKRKRVGVKAQEVQEKLLKLYNTDNYANLVNEDLYDSTDTLEDVESQKSVAYSNFVPFLIGAIQELTKEIEILKTQINKNN